ncbi:isoaspartyl peptidase/L-asparaginase [Luminiphilus sp.]|nr:isoaspartyl peptidase/L-asparaginase [Luminiphilus sp.]MDB3918522.1 isoaspartyl peptidase/L-asparaginase [Luminiphilus sp.]MDB3933444.1 isoaspartyl peptidase/L-asparaginase [Luminiphilus sp.]
MRWLLMCLSMVSTMAVAESSPVAIALHGGAGTIERGKMSAELEATYRVFLEAAITDGHRQLAAGHPGLDVVVNVIQKMEDSPLFNAGKGAVYTWDGRHELDASIMHGQQLEAGAVAGVTTVKSPIALARTVMEDSPHVMLAAKGAEAFATAQGIESVDPDYFGTERRRKALEAYKADEYAGVEPEADYKFGTVGVVVLDKAGNLVAGTSTGGMTGKRWGRVGDSPIIGAGTYADNRSCAVSATGHGEFFIRHTVARDICARMQFGGASLHDATAEVVLKALVAAGGEGGVAAVDRAGNVALTFNTPGMYRASINATGVKTVGIFGDDE